MEVRTLNVRLPEDIEKLKWNGQYDLMKEVIDYRLKKDIPADLKERLLLEKEIIDVLPREYIYSKEQALAILKENIIGFVDEEFDTLFMDGALDFLYINGEMKFKNDFLENVVKTRIQYKNRYVKEIPTKTVEALDSIITKMEKEGEARYRIHLKLSLKLKEDYEKEGKIIRVWLPIPVEYAQVEDFKIISMSPEGIINGSEVNHRSVYFEVEYHKGMEFFVEYEFINHALYHKLDPAKVKRSQPDFYLEEEPPHYVFTPYLIKLTQEIIQDEKNPLLKAKMIYEWITTHVIYSYVRPYFTLPCIPEYATTGMKGDCGILASLFITMCRIARIPATWQAGLYANPHDVGNHDWASFYIAPYGWLYADCSFGGSAHRAGSDLRYDFYFGNIDPFRIPSSRDFQQDLEPKNKFTRRDPYDHQTGEVEYIDEPIDCDGYSMEQTMLECEIL